MRRITCWPRRFARSRDARQESRWSDMRTVLASFRGTECLGKTRDVSMGGMGLSLKGGWPTPGEEMRVDVVFETEVFEFLGRAVYVLPKRWGSVVGLRWNRSDLETRGFLATRYVSSSEDLGSVT